MNRVRWIVPSAVAACAGGLCAGVFEGSGGLLAHGATIGLVAMLAIPILFVASLAMRGLVRAWGARELMASWREARGGMPRLAAWTGVVWLGALGLAWAMFQGTWLLASWTAFKPASFRLFAPLLALLALLVIVVLSKPAADLMTIVARWIDHRWQRLAPGTLLSVPVIATGALVTACGVGALLWLLLVQRRLPTVALPVGSMLGVVVAIAATIVMHLAWRGPWLARAIAGGLVGAATIAAIGAAVVVVRGEPAIAIRLWATQPITRLSLERFDIERIRRELPLDSLRPPARAGNHPDVVLISFAGVRAESTPPYGGAAPMPAIRDLGERGTVFLSAYATSSRTGSSIASLIVGVTPNRLHGSIDGDDVHLDPRHVTLAERLRAAGYDTAVFACCPAWGDRATGWTRGFADVAIDDDPARLAYAAREWVKARASGPPLFLSLHLSIVPAIAPAVTGGDRLQRYDAAFADLVSAFATRTTEAAPIVIVTADRGEDTRDELTNPQLHVPLLIAGPGIKPQRVSETVSLVDLVPTLVELAGFQPPRGSSIDGRSLADVALGRRPGNTVTGVAFSWLPEEGGRKSTASLVRGNWKLIDAEGAFELYDLRDDPDEKTNLVGKRMQIVAELRALLNLRARAAKQSPF